MKRDDRTKRKDWREEGKIEKRPKKEVEAWKCGSVEVRKRIPIQMNDSTFRIKEGWGTGPDRKKRLDEKRLDEIGNRPHENKPETFSKIH